jgi:hypothetical protein
MAWEKKTMVARLLPMGAMIKGLWAMTGGGLLLAAAQAPAADKTVSGTVTVKVSVDSQAAGYEGWKALDGDPTTIWHTPWGGDGPIHPHEIVVDLGAVYSVSGFAYLPRTDRSTNGTIREYECYVSVEEKQLGRPAAKGTFPHGNQGEDGAREHVVRFPAPQQGRYVRLRALSEVAGRHWTSIAELRVLVEGVQFRAEKSSALLATEKKTPSPPRDKSASPVVFRPRTADSADPYLQELEDQFVSLQYDLQQRGHFARVARQTFRSESLICESDRDPADVVLRRTAALLADLKRRVVPAPLPPAQSSNGAPATSAATGLAAAGKEKSPVDFAAFEHQLRQLQTAAQQTPVVDEDARFRLYLDACRLRRRIALANPLLDFDKLLFIKRHRARYDHMCDQYYGINAVPGGGIYVLHDPFGPTPKLHDVLANSVVERGRLAGRRLEGGSFLSPDLSFDARQIAFAYVECEGPTHHDHHTDPTRGHWSVGRSYHLFKVNVDGTGLEQLTDGTWNDFDPCWLPNGRIAFISERRGGYLRCGRVCPTYTLYDMAADGSDIRCLSVHETNEWHPSVTHDGRIIYTRWDYVDRHGCTAHLPWITTLDGRDSRAVHGNFAPRHLRPDMELDCRAVPGSHKYVATAAPHHGQAYGSLVLIDPHVEDDDGMAPLKRLTPEVPFPESQGKREAQVYGTPWPLSEDYYLCVYDPLANPGVMGQGMQGRAKPARFNYGIYLIDSFGNKELLYRDAAIPCLSPIPLRPRPMPPVMPSEWPSAVRKKAGTEQVESVGGAAAEGTLVVINSYDGLKPWPPGTKVRALRVLQLLPMTVPSGSPPHEIGVRIATAEDSVTPVRYVLGTVPVEEDGSAHFVAPAHKELFFQALDERGLAVQSMRSATYLQPGERLVCQGCHEPRHRAPAIPAEVPLALPALAD